MGTLDDPDARDAGPVADPQLDDADVLRVSACLSDDDPVDPLAVGEERVAVCAEDQIDLPGDLGGEHAVGVDAEVREEDDRVGAVLAEPLRVLADERRAAGGKG